MILRPTDFYHKEDKLNELISIINSISDEYFIVMEHTGHYHYPMLKKLDNEHLTVSVMNPFVIKKYGDVQIRKAKTDKRMPVNSRLANYIMQANPNLKFAGNTI